MSKLFGAKGFLLPHIQNEIMNEFSLTLVEELLILTQDRVEALALQSYLFWEINDRVLERLMDLRNKEENL